MNKLFICTMGKMRSKTAAHVFGGRFAGLDAEAKRHVSQDDLDWADVIYCMEKSHRSKLRRKFKGYSHKIKVLHIPDEFVFLQGELVDILRSKVPN